MVNQNTWYYSLIGGQWLKVYAKNSASYQFNDRKALFYFCMKNPFHRCIFCEKDRILFFIEVEEDSECICCMSTV